MLPFTFNQQTSTSRVGTYGQYSLGIAGQIVNTGWLGFVRVDYRNGDHIDGWTGNGGIRYQFSPGDDCLGHCRPRPQGARRSIGPTNWTGFYAGGFFGAAAGRTDIGFVTTPTAGTKPWVFGPLGGIELGYDYQFGNDWVLGLEGDIGAANVHGGADRRPSARRHPLHLDYFHRSGQDQLDATATARVGYAWGRTLYYVKGGAAFEDSTISPSATTRKARRMEPVAPIRPAP